MHIITGGAGFLGSALLWKLNSLGIDDIIIVDNLGKSGKWRNLVKYSYRDYIQRDKFREMIRAGKTPFKVDTITHLGACSSTTEPDADFLMDNNFHYSQEVCAFGLELGARVINASSAATFGAGENGFADGAAIAPKLRPLNMYGYSKQLLDLWLIRENLVDSLASLKFFNVYGPNEYHKGPMASVASKIFGEIQETGKATLFASSDPAIADGEQKRDFVYVKDCVDLMAWLLLDAPEVNGIHNVGSGEAATFNRMAEAVFAAMDKPARIEYRQMPDSLARNYQNYTRADMGWLATANYPGRFRRVEAGMDDYVRNYLAQADRYL